MPAARCARSPRGSSSTRRKRKHAVGEQGEFLEELSLLAAGIDSLADERLGFRTFFFPRARDGENWNFYSGEALLFWAQAARRGLSIAPSLEIRFSHSERRY